MEIFGNVFFACMIFCVSIFCYDVINSNQKMILVYSYTVALSAFGILDWKKCIIFLVIVSFIYLEYFIKDNEKFRYIKQIRFKIYDYLLLSIVQYGIVWVILAIILASPSVITYLTNLLELPKKFVFLYYIPAIFSLLKAINTTSALVFKVKNVTEIMNEFSPEIYNINFTNNDYDDYFGMLVDIEDRSYFERGAAYNILSVNFWRVRLKKMFKHFNFGLIKQLHNFIDKNQVIRGYSTLEMQLVRSIGISDNHEPYRAIRIGKRKIFELVYTKILLTSLERYFRSKEYTNSEYFKEYLLLIYVQSVNTRIAGKKKEHMIDVFSKSVGTREQKLNVENWNKEAFFVACLGLCHQSVTTTTVLQLRPDLIEKYKLQEDKILQVVVEAAKK